MLARKRSFFILMTCTACAFLYASCYELSATEPEYIPAEEPEQTDPNEEEWSENLGTYVSWSASHNVVVNFDDEDFARAYQRSLPSPYIFCYARFDIHSSAGRFQYGYPYGVSGPGGGTGSNFVNYAIWVGKRGSWTNQVRSWLHMTVVIIGYRGSNDPGKQAYCRRKRDENYPKYTYGGRWPTQQGAPLPDPE